MNDDIPRDEFLQFLGWLSADIPELHNFEVPKLLDSWDRFQIRLNDRTDAHNGFEVPK
jgi:hypothetical protein